MKSNTRAIKKFGNVLRRLRSERGLTQEELADMLNKDRAYVSQMERGLKNVSLSTLVLIAEALDVDVVFAGEALFES